MLTTSESNKNVLNFNKMFFAFAVTLTIYSLKAKNEFF